MHFSETVSNGISVWRSDPDCQTAHDDIVQFLRQRGANFVPQEQVVGTRRFGNIGEHIAFRIGLHGPFHNYERHSKNAYEPLSNISSSGVDILWFLLHPVNIAEDLVIIQETKATADPSLQYANALIADHKKLFSRNPEFTLATRLSSLSTYLEMNRSYDESLTHRLTRLGATSAKLCTQVRLVPTLLHDANHVAEARLLAVRISIKALGWDDASIKPWSIALYDFANRLERIARGKS